MTLVQSNYWLVDEQATIDLGKRLAKSFNQGGVIYLQGTLGAGKTTLTRGLLRGLGHSGPVKSPTYTLVESYSLEQRQVFHFDLYRLGDPEELEYMGIRDYFSEQNLCIVEWPVKGQGVLPEPDLVLELAVVRQGRTASLRAPTERGAAALKSLLTESAHTNHQP